MKPCIKRDYSETYREFTWFCRGFGCLGIGDTPELAYLSWKRLADDKKQRKVKC